MADSSISVLDSTGAARAVDAQTVGTDFQQTVTIGNGVNAGRVLAVESDGSARVGTNLSTTSTLTNVTSVLTSATILAANANRRGFMVFNESTSILYLKINSGAASTTSYSVRVASMALYVGDVPLYTGAITGTWGGTANGFARVTEFAA